MGEDKLRTSVTGRSDGVLTLGKNRLGLDQLPIADSSLVELALAMSKEDTECGSDLALAYAYALEEDGRLKSNLRRIDGDKMLKDDAPSLGSYMARGQLASDIRACAAADLTRLEGSHATEIVEALTRVAPYIEDIDFLERRRPELVQLARATYSVAVDSMPLAQLFNGQLEELGEGRCRVTYDFSNPEQLNDFRRDDSPRTNAYYMISAYLCDDGADSMIENFNFGTFVAIDRATGFRGESGMDALHTLYPGETYQFGIDHDGQKATWITKGVRKNSVSVGPRQSGDVFFMVHCNMATRISRFSVEGKLPPDGPDRLRAMKVEALIQALFDS
ncbi:MAG: hypothetical protein ACJA2W_000071 [Planctomycetota bacterium]